MIGEIASVIEMGADAVDIGKTTHPHRTLGESIGMAACPEGAAPLQRVGKGVDGGHVDAKEMLAYQQTLLAPWVDSKVVATPSTRSCLSGDQRINW